MDINNEKEIFKKDLIGKLNELNAKLNKGEALSNDDMSYLLMSAVLEEE